MSSRQTIALIGILVVSLPFSAARAGGDAAAGKALSTACQACHISDASDSSVPRLAGQREGYLARQLRAYRAGDRANAVMGAIVKELDDAAIDNLAAYWASQAAGSDTTVPPEIAAVKHTKMAFPRDFPSGFVLYQTKNREDNGTVSMRYVNRIGLQAARDGKPMPSGSVIILANHAAQLDRENKPVVAKEGTWQPDKIINGYAGMEARAGWSKDVPKLLLNEPVPGVNWNYAEFTADKKPRPESNQAVCLACHRPAAKTSFVYGYSLIKAAATAR